MILCFAEGGSRVKSGLSLKNVKIDFNNCEINFINSL